MLCICVIEMVLWNNTSMKIDRRYEEIIEKSIHKSFQKIVYRWVQLMEEGVRYRRKCTYDTIKTNLSLIKHYLKHLRSDYSNFHDAYEQTVIETNYMKQSSKKRLYNTVVSFIRSVKRRVK